MLSPDNLQLSDKIIVSWSDIEPGVTGRDLAELAKEKGISMEQCSERLSPGGGIFFLMDEDDVQSVLKYENAMIGSDGLFF